MSATKAATPNFAYADEALGFVMRAIEAAGYRAGEDCHLGCDAAASEFYKNGRYEMAGEGKSLDAGGMVEYPRGPGRALPDRHDRGRHGRGRFGRLAAADGELGAKVQLVGDDLFVTNPERLEEGIERTSPTRS